MPTPKKKPIIDPAKTYSISLISPVEIAPHVWARPGDIVTIPGTQLAEIESKVENYTEV